MKAISYNLAHWKKFFFTIWSGQAVSLFGSSLVSFALVWHMTVTTGSAIVLTTATIVTYLPSILITPFLGVVVDRWNRRLVMILADGLTALFTLLLTLLFLGGVVEIWHIYILLFVRSVTSDLHYVAMRSATALMVPEKDLTRVAGYNRSLQGLMNIAGPPIGALFLAIMPISSVLFIDVFTALAAILPLLIILIPEPDKQKSLEEAGTKITVLQDFLAGFRYVLSWKGLMAMTVISLLTNFLAMPVISLTPLLITEHFKGGAMELGWIESAIGIGVILGGIILGAWGGFKNRIHTTLVGGIVAALSILIVAFAPSKALLIGVTGFFMLGIALPFLDGPLDVILQSKVSPEMQGRVFSFLMSAGKLALPLGLFVSGQLAVIIGVRFWFFVGGVGWLLINIIGFNVPVLVNMEEEAYGTQAAPADLQV